MAITTQTIHIEIAYRQEKGDLKTISSKVEHRFLRNLMHMLTPSTFRYCATFLTKYTATLNTYLCLAQPYKGFIAIEGETNRCSLENARAY